MVPDLEGPGHRSPRVCCSQRCCPCVCPRCSSCLITARRLRCRPTLLVTQWEARDRGWDRLSNGDLLAEAERAGFDVLLTADNGIAYQQNLKDRRIALVVLTRNRWRLVQRVIRKVVAAVNAAEPGSYTLIDIPI